MSAEQNFERSKAQLEEIGEKVDTDLLDKVIKGLGIANQNVDAALVAAKDKAECDRVITNFLENKLGLMDDDEANQSGLDAVLERLAGFQNKQRGAVYYLLTKHFNKEDVYS